MDKGVPGLANSAIPSAGLRKDAAGLATFSLFAQRVPARGGFVVAAGVEECLRYLEGFRVSERYTGLLLAMGYDRSTATALRGTGFVGSVRAVAEGRVLFAGEPLIEVTAPAPVARLVQPALLERVRLQTTVASWAARCVLTAAPANVIDHPGEGAPHAERHPAVARAAVIGGFAGTADGRAAERYGLPLTETFFRPSPDAPEGGPEQASRPGGFDGRADTLLLRAGGAVDTSTVDAVREAIGRVRRLRSAARVSLWLAGEVSATRAVRARQALDRAGLRAVTVMAGGAAGEWDIAALALAGAPLDGHLLDARLPEDRDGAAVRIVSRLVEYQGRPVRDADEWALPGAKQVYRSERGDLVVRCGEGRPMGSRPLLSLVMLAGRRTAGRDSVAVARARCEQDLMRLHARTRAQEGLLPVRLSAGLRRLLVAEPVPGTNAGAARPVIADAG